MLLIARHGQTEMNAQGCLLGRLDPPLTPLGIEQAAGLGRALSGASRVICSPLLRARQTATAIGLPVEIDERWIEIDYGIYDGLALSDVPPELWARWREDPGYAPEGGESLSDVSSRVAHACEDIAKAAVNEDIVVVTHVSPMKAAVGWTLGVHDEVMWRLFVAVASLTRIVITERGPVMHSFNEIHHLAPVAPFPGTDTSPTTVVP